MYMLIGPDDTGADMDPWHLQHMWPMKHCLPLEFDIDGWDVGLDHDKWSDTYLDNSNLSWIKPVGRVGQ